MLFMLARCLQLISNDTSHSPLFGIRDLTSPCWKVPKKRGESASDDCSTLALPGVVVPSHIWPFTSHEINEINTRFRAQMALLHLHSHFFEHAHQRPAATTLDSLDYRRSPHCRKFYWIILSLLFHYMGRFRFAANSSSQFLNFGVLTGLFH